MIHPVLIAQDLLLKSSSQLVLSHARVMQLLPVYMHGMQEQMSLIWEILSFMVQATVL
jgi:hypothetical protein